MLFCFSDFNHCPQGRRAIEDIVAIMGHQLIDLGHEVYWPTGLPEFVGGGPGRINVLLEAFTDDDCIDTVARAHAAGCRFLFVATEEPTPLGFNSGNNYGMIDRQRVFPDAARYAAAILHLVPGDAVGEWYGRYAPSARAELGYSESLRSPSSMVEPPFDFGFFGQMTPRRVEILNRLRDVGSVLVEARLELPREVRDAEMRRAKVIVTVRAQDNVEYVSSTRCAAAILFGRPVVAEPHAVHLGWDDVIDFATSMDGFYEAARAALGSWRSLHEEQLDRMALYLTPDACLGRALREVGLCR